MEKQPKRKPAFFSKENWPLGKILFFVWFTPIFISLAICGWFGWHGRTVDIEGETLIEKIAAAQKVYYAKYNTFYSIGETPVSYDAVLSVDARKNKYFPTFSGTANGETFTLKIYGNPKKFIAQDTYFIAMGNKDTLKAINFFMNKDYPVRELKY